MPTYVRLFGAPRVERDGGTQVLRPERRHQLAAWLALRAAPVSRDQLAALFWPEHDNAGARRNLRKLAFDVATFAWAAGIGGDRGTLAWRVATDVADFERALAEQRVDDALALYRGPLCQGLEDAQGAAFAEALGFERARLSERWRGVVLAQMERAAPERRLELAQRLLAVDALDEDAVAALLTTYAALGHGSEAARVYREFNARLAETIGVEPSTRLRELAGESESGPVATHAAPAPASGFVGRAAELQEFGALLARAECRLLTVTGPGGIGKSRLARTALDVFAGHFSSAFWIDLEDLTDDSQIAARVAAAVGVALTGNTDPLTLACDALRGRDALLVLDNAEHLPGAGTLAETLAGACPRAKLVVTSRARLGVAGEWLLPLSGLPVPDADESEPELVRGFDAVKLFELRARAASPAFKPERESEEVARLVRRLEGAPLAIELAAAWVRLLPVAEIRADIERSLDLLEDAGSAPDRQRSVRASFEHSWRLLTPIGRRALVRLALFVAPFTRSAAEQVAGATLPVLAALADKSLLRAHGDGRFSFHALTRQCAGERLEEADAPAARRRYVDYHVKQLAYLGDAARVSQKESLAAIESALEDFRCVWGLALEAGDVRAVESMAGGLMCFFDIRARWEEGLALLGEAQQHLAEDRPDHQAAIAAVRRAVAGLAYRKGDLLRAEASARSAHALYRSLRRVDGVRRSLQILALALWHRGEIIEAQRHFEQGLRLAQRCGDEAGSAVPLCGIGLCEVSRGRYARALAVYERALELFRRTGSLQNQALTLNNMSIAFRSRRQWQDALRCASEALALCEAHGLATVRSHCLVSLASIDIGLDRLVSAQQHLQRALDDEKQGGEGQCSAEIRLGLGQVRALLGDHQAARRWLGDGLAHAQAGADVPMQVYALLCFAELAAREGDTPRAARLLHLVEAHPRAEHSHREEARRRIEQLGLAPRAGATRGARLELDEAVAQLLTSD